MKKLFALLSTFVLALAVIGLVTPTASAADSDKWTVDPTLASDEIPMYEMGSIYTTFPNFYDNAAKPDTLWGGSTRMYPWNETRLRVAQFDAEGNATGKYYAIYFSGLTKATNDAGLPASGAGNNINGYAKKDGEVTTVRVKSNTWGKDVDPFTYNAMPMDPSLSHLRMNFAGEDIAVDMITVSTKIGDASNRQNLYNRMFVFDAQGRIIRGVAMDGFYVKPGAEGAAEDLWAPLFCRVDGKVVLYTDDVTPDKVKEQAKDEEGNLLFDDEAKTIPTMVETDQDDLVYQRFMWEWFEEAPTNVNTATYKAEGWDCDLWDYVIASPDGNGYMAIAFLNAEGSNHLIKDEERAITNATREAKGEAKLAEGEHFRECVREIRIPKDGGTFDFGYLDKGVATEAAKFNNIIRGAFLNGRKVAEGEDTFKCAEVKTYNFSTTGLKYVNQAVNGHSYQLMDRNQLYVEVLKGEEFNPGKLINYEGLASTWLEANNLLSYSKDLNSLSYTLYVDGQMVVYKYAYADKAEMIADFEKDVRAFFYNEAKPEESKHQDYTVDKTQSVGWDFISTSYNEKCFWANAANREKWAWMVNYVAQVRKNSGLSAAHWETIDQGLTASPGTFNAEIEAFLTNTQKNPGAWNRTSDYTVEENANGFLPKETNQQSFLNYTFSTADSHIDQKHTVVYEVKNSSGLSDKMTVMFTVVDGYTPIIKVNKDALYVEPQVVDGRVVIPTIDPMTLVTAYNAVYNSVNGILGDDITVDVHFDTTLDFDKPTEGVHQITAWVERGSKRAEKTFTLEIADVTAPYVEFYGSLVLPYGTTWDPKLVVKAANDNIHGNLFNSTITWCVDISSKIVDTTKPGKYNVKVAIYDAAGNSVETPKAIPVTVLPEGATKQAVADLNDVLESISKTVGEISLDEILTKLEDLATTEQVNQVVEAIKSLPVNASKTEIINAIEGVKTDVAGVKTDVAGVKTDVEGLASAKGCKKSAMFFEFLAAGCLLVFLLRRKH